MTKETLKKYMILITYTMLLLLILINIKDIWIFLLNIIKVLSPLWIGIALAFTLNVPMSIIEREVFGKTSKGIRIISLISSIMLVLLLFTILFVWVIPDFIDSATYLVGQIPKMIENLNTFLIDTFRNTELSEYLNKFSNGAEISNIFSSLFKTLINNFSGFLSNFVAFVINLITGIIIAVYLLLEKEHILGEIKKLIKNLFDKKVVKKIKEVFVLSNKSFHDFITYQCLECLILGILMFIAFMLFKFPYALTIAFLTTITAIIPIFGATIACIIGFILIGTVSLKEAVLFVIVFQVIQQIENNVIYPRVVGKHVGLPPIITIMAIIVGGSFGGFFGMLICIPLTSILYSLFWTKMQTRENKQKNKSA